jgi:hypothetical protein
MKQSLRTVVLLALISIAAGTRCQNGCLNDIYKGVEAGKQFHPLWPFISGVQTVGTVVEAKKAKKPEAYFGSIDDPAYKQGGAKSLPVSTIEFVTPSTCSSASNIGALVAFSQLDALSKSATQGAKAQSLTATPSQVTAPKTQAPASTPVPASSTNPAAPASTPAPASPANPAAPAPGGTQPAVVSDGSKTSTTNPAEALVDKGAYSSTTGVDFSHITAATLKITGLTVQYYDLPILTKLNSGVAGGILNPTGVDALSDKDTWIISRAVTAATLEYTLISDSDVHASFLAQLASWLPGVQFKWASARVITLTTTSPVTIGYKLWHPGTGFSGAAASACSIHGCEIGGDDVDKDLFGAK